MFSRASSKNSDVKNGTPAVQPRKPAAPSIISTDMRIVGDLVSEGEIQIDGVVDGDIRSNVLLVGEPAQVRGEIIADTVKVHGTVTGQIKARTVILARTARMIGDILHENLGIEEGAFLEGHCKRIDAKAEVNAKVNLVVKDGAPVAAELKKAVG